MANPFEKHQQTLQQYTAFVQMQGGDEVTGSKFNFQWKGGTYACTFKRVRQSYVSAGGLTAQSYLVLTVMENMPGPGPQEKDEISFDGKTWIVELIEEVLGANTKLTCFDPGRGT